MEDVWIFEHHLRSLGSALSEIIVVGIHAGYHILAHSLEHTRYRSLLATVQMLVA